MHRSVRNSRIGSAVLALGTMAILTRAVVALATRGVGELLTDSVQQTCNCNIRI